MMRRIIAALGLLAVLAFAAVQFSPWSARTLHEEESQYGRIQVVERRSGLRELYTGEGRARQSAVHAGRPMHLELTYSRAAVAALGLVSADARILYVGLGGGAMPMHAHALVPDARIDVVEIDPAIVRVAIDYFGFQPDDRLRAFVDDGRAFIEHAQPGSYDLIVLDAFSDDQIPQALTTREFLLAVRAALADDGVVASNLWTRQRDYERMVATYQAVFGGVVTLEVPGRAQRILVAAASPDRLQKEALVLGAERVSRGRDLGYDLPRMVRSGYQVPGRSGAAVLSDPS